MEGKDKLGIHEDDRQPMRRFYHPFPLLPDTSLQQMASSYVLLIDGLRSIADIPSNLLEFVFGLTNNCASFYYLSTRANLFA